MTCLRGLIAGGPALTLTLTLTLTVLGLGCAGGDSPSGILDVYVDHSQCVTPLHCGERFGLTVLRGGCVHSWATKMGDSGELTLGSLDFEVGSVQVQATCGTESCVRCFGAGSFAEERRLDLALQPVVACRVSSAVTTPCAECGPSEGSYCDGNRRVSCVEGKTQIETCPEGCAAGACGACTKTTFYKDIDGDTYGDANVKIEACMPPPSYVTSDTDCDDSDIDAHPMQTKFFTTPTLSAKDYDYDCNNVEEQERTDKERNCIYVASTNSCTGGGWRGSVPACGQSGTYVTCTRTLAVLCISTPAPATQACR